MNRTTQSYNIMVLGDAPITTITGNQKAIEVRQPSHIGWPLLQQQYQLITTRDGSSFIDQILSIRTFVVSEMQGTRRKKKRKSVGEEGKDDKVERRRKRF